MSSSVSATPLAFEIRASRWIVRCVFCIYALAALTVVVLPVPWWAISVALAVLLGCGVATHRRRVSLRDARAIVALARSVDGTWQLRTAHGIVHHATLLSDTYVHDAVIVLNFRLSDGQRRSVVLLRDSTDAICLRRLRAGLALGRAKFQSNTTRR